MTLHDFKNSLDTEHPPPGLSLALLGLWHDGKGDWDKAHECAQEQEDAEGSWVHAYLHRKEGDHSNARYWYAQAQRPFFPGSLDDEWNSIVAALLDSAE